MAKNMLTGKHKPKRLQQLVAQNITELRKKKGIFQKDVALQLGLTPKDFSFIENGYVDIHLSMLESIADVLKVSVQELFNPSKTDTSFESYLIEKAKLLFTLDKEPRDILLRLADIFISRELTANQKKTNEISL